jgi:hypothetical protein
MAATTALDGVAAQRPVALDARLAARAPAQRAARRELAQVRERAAVVRDVLVDQEGVERERVDVARHARVDEDRARLGAEPQRPVAMRPVQRLLAHPVAGEQQLAATGVPEREGEEPAQALDAARAELLVEVQHDLGVAGAAEGVAAGAQLGPQGAVVDDLAVEHEHERPVLVGHRLLGADRVDDGQADHAQPDRPAHPRAAAVGAAMAHGLAHVAHELGVDGLATAHASGDPAHQRTLRGAAGSAAASARISPTRMNGRRSWLPCRNRLPTR